MASASIPQSGADCLVSTVQSLRGASSDELLTGVRELQKYLNTQLKKDYQPELYECVEELFDCELAVELCIDCYDPVQDFYASCPKFFDLLVRNSSKPLRAFA
jgi:hypothetical protein